MATGDMRNRVDRPANRNPAKDSAALPRQRAA